MPFAGIGWTAPDFHVPPTDKFMSLIDPEDTSAGGKLLKRLDARGRAGGLEGVIYENRDGQHSPMPRKEFPRLIQLRFGPDLKKRQLHWGLAGRIFLPAIVIGNSSTAVTGGLKRRSQARLAMTSPGEARRAFLTYSNNHLYLYPEHRDHDDYDRFPANWPYMVISQGSSFSDKPFMRALIMSIAAMPEDTREFLRKRSLMAPTLQMILRRNQKNVRTRAAYMSGGAHPTVFNKDQLASERMVGMAAGLLPKEVPPMVRLRIEDEDFSDAAGLAGLSEKLFDTPSAIARIWRAHDYRREMTVSVQDTRDPNNRDLSFEWVVLRGDPKKVRISLLDSTGTRARIRIDWHDPWNMHRLGKLMTDRVDIGVFAWNGVHDSAPAMISISFPSHQKRVYEQLGTQMRLSSIDYSGGEDAPYYDPTLHWAALWRDEFEYDDAGDIALWRRVMPEETVVLRHPDWQMQPAAPVYTMKKHKRGPLLVMQSKPGN